MNQTETQRDDTTVSQRGAFEKWAKTEYPLATLGRICSSYTEPKIDGAWSAWQVDLSQPAASAEVVEIFSALIDHAIECERQLDVFHNLGDNAGAGYSDVVCKAKAALSTIPAQPNPSTSDLNNKNSCYSKMDNSGEQAQRIHQLESALRKVDELEHLTREIAKVNKGNIIHLVRKRDKLRAVIQAALQKDGGERW
jgi:hypothetical protein